MPGFARDLLGREDAEWFLQETLPGIESWAHLQLLEHMLCEAYKIVNYKQRASKLRKPTADVKTWRRYFTQLARRWGRAGKRRKLD